MSESPSILHSSGEDPTRTHPSNEQLDDTYMVMEDNDIYSTGVMEDTYTVACNSYTDKDTFPSEHNIHFPKPKPRNKVRTKSYEMAVSESGVEDSDPNVYLPMTSNKRIKDKSNVSSSKPVPAPRPMDLDKKLALERERKESQMFKQNRPVNPTRKAPPPPLKPSPDVIKKHFELKQSKEEIVIKEKITIVKEDDEKKQEREPSKRKSRPRSSTWYENGMGESIQSESNIPVINYVEIAENDAPRPLSAYLERDIKLPTKKKHSKSFLSSGIIDTLKAWTSSSNKSDKSPKGSESSMKRNSKFYSDPEFIKSASSSFNESNENPPVPSPRSHSGLKLPLPSPRNRSSTGHDGSTSSPPPVPPPRQRSKESSFDKGDSFDDVFPVMPTSISSDTGLDILAKGQRVFRFESDTIPEDMAPPVPSQTEIEDKPPDKEDSPIPTPLLRPIGSISDHPPTANEQLHLPVHEMSHDEDTVDSLDVFIPPIEHQRMVPRKAPTDSDQSQVYKRRILKPKRNSTIDDLDVVVHEDTHSSSDDDGVAGYAEPQDLARSGSCRKPSSASSEQTPPALPPRDKLSLQPKRVPLPPTSPVTPPTADASSSVDSQGDDLDVPVLVNSNRESACRQLNVYSDPPTRCSFYDSNQNTNSTCDYSVSETIASSVDNVPDVNDLESSVPPPLPNTSPPRGFPVLCVSDNLPSNTANQSRDLDCSAGERNDEESDSLNSTLSLANQTSYANVPSDNECDSKSDKNETRPDLHLTLPRKSSTTSSSSCDSPDSSSQSECSTSSLDESDDNTLHDTQCSHSGDTTPVSETKSLLGSIIGDRASIDTLTPHTSVQNSIDYANDTSSDSEPDDIYTEITDDDTLGAKSNKAESSPMNYLNEPVRLRRQKAYSKDSGSLRSYTSSDSSSRPASWASFTSYGSSDYSPGYTPQPSTVSDDFVRPISGESGVSSDISVMSSDLSGLSLADSTHGSIDSGQCSDGPSEEDMLRAKEDKRQRKQFLVAQEIMTSEQNFVDVIKLLNEDFRQVIGQSSKAIGSPVVPPQVLNQILRHLPELQVFSEGLLHDLRERVEHWEENPRIADIFVKKGAFLKLYTGYIREYDAKCAVLDDARKKHVEFDRCTSKFEESTRCYKLTLRHYMLKPVQRIPQYRLLLRDYQKYLKKGTEEYEATKVALNIVTEVAEHANESMKYGENLNKLLEIQNKLVGRFEVIKPGRRLVKEGMLNKVSRKELQPRMFFLMDDVLLYTAPYTYNTYQLKNVLPLVGMRVQLPSEETDEDYKNEFSILSTQRSFTLAAETEAEKEAWVSALREVIAINNDKRKTFTPDVKLGEPVVSGNTELDGEFKLGSRHPVWIPDDRVSMCMLCSAEFTLIFRRHHCRACGRVCCYFCSDYQAPLRYLQNKPSRVCKNCYTKLKKEVRASTRSSVGGAVAEGEDSTLGLLSLFSKSAHTLRKSAHKQLNRVSQLRGSFGIEKKKTKSKTLQQARANDGKASVGGYLKVWKDKKWVRNWYNVKGNVLYKFKGSEDTAAIGSTVVLGYEVRAFPYTFQGVDSTRLFELIHKGLPSLLFRTESEVARNKWMKACIVATVPQ